VRVRVIRKLADSVDGVDLSRYREGDVVDLAERDARLIVAEEWAVPARRRADSIPFASDRRGSDVYQRLRDKHEQIEEERRRLQRRTSDQTQPYSPHTA
jgi:hypothetical protein